VYFCGTVLMAVASYPAATTEWLFMFAFFGLAAVGAGGLKSNVITMGGDQFDASDADEVKQKET
jgi:dipeptide/tripeptide permease